MPFMERVADEGVEIADLETRVVPHEHLAMEWGAFATLSTDRQVGFGRGPIPSMAIDRYAERQGITDPDEFARFMRIIQAMDRTYLKYWADHDRSSSPKIG